MAPYSEATSWTQVSTEHVEEFFSKLGEVINNYLFDGNDIWNVDETGITKMQTSDKVDAKRDTKGQVFSLA